MNEFISEKIIEDILSSDKSILAEIISANPANLSLIARQKVLRSGKLDLLYLYQNELLLIELKVEDFYFDIIRQIDGYFQDLQELQAQHKLISAEIRKIVLVRDAKPEEVEKCKEHSIQLLSYKPQHVLSKYYENFREISYFLKLQSGDYGMVRLSLLKTTLQLLSQGKNIEDICRIENRAEKTIKNRLSVAALLGLVAKLRQEYFLTDFGEAFLEARDEQASERLNDRQIELLSNFVKENPFYSSITYTVFSIIESVFVLAKNIYPVPKDAVEDYFVKSVGKGTTWRTDKAHETATYIFSNYACEMEFLAKVDNHFYITPKGIQAILLLQLNRSLKLIESQK
jgi:hypothetical protein